MGVVCCDLLGVSLGGAIALNFALDHPRRVRRLVLVSPGITAWDWSDEWRTLWAAITDAARSVGVARARELWWEPPDRKSVVSGQSVSARVDIGCRRSITKKKK